MPGPGLLDGFRQNLRGHPAKAAAFYCQDVPPASLTFFDSLHLIAPEEYLQTEAIDSGAFKQRKAVSIDIIKNGADRGRAEQLLLDPSLLAAAQKIDPPPTGFSEIQYLHFVALIKLAQHIATIAWVIP